MVNKVNLNYVNSLKKKNLIALSIAKIVHGFGIGIFTVVYQPFLLELTESLVITGIIVSIGTIMQFLPMPWVGKLSDKLGHKKTFLFSTPIYIFGLVAFLFASADAIYLLIFGISIYFLGNTLNTLNSQFLVSVNSNSSKGLMYGIVFTSFFIGSILGNSFVVVGTNLNAQLFFLTTLIAIGIEGFIIYLGIDTRGYLQHELNHKEKLTPKKGGNKIWVSFIKDQRMRAIIIFFTADLLVYGISLSIYNAALSDFYHLTTAEISFVVLWMNITNMLFQIPAGRVADKLGKMKTLVLSECFGLTFFAFNIIAPFLWVNAITEPLLPLLILGRICFAFSIVFFIPSEQIILTDLGKDKKAEAYGVVSFARGIAFVPTGLIGGFLIANVNYIVPFVLSTIGIGFEIWFLFKFFKHE